MRLSLPLLALAGALLTASEAAAAPTLPDTDGVRLGRVDVVPDGRRGMLVGLRIGSPGQARRVTVSVDARSELMGVYPWGETAPGQTRFNL